MSKWIAGISMLYIGCLALSLIAEHSLSANASDMNVFTSLLSPTSTDFGNPIAALNTLWTDAWQYIKLLFQIIFLWFPDLWTGAWLWFYYFILFPITLATIFSIMSMLRGTVATA